MRLFTLITVAAAACCIATGASASLGFTFDGEAYRTAEPGTRVSFLGSFEYLSGIAGSQLNINSAVFTLEGMPELGIDRSPLDLRLPLVLAQNQRTEVMPLFDIDVAPSTPEDVYYGSVLFYGGPDANSQELLGSGNFAVEVIVPEPAGLLTLLTGFGGLALRLRRTTA